ncbi:SDR family oxidoreductase [Pararhodobacter sp. SW119]|uniref:SDR family oxidoreductase n=1 Tax=Pararhodobacter sp. SW119 TaxID=2780075 RepID=UPI001AE03343|nr:SDR family oxidoreductase [Pararhodobacter sp. SW119]
MRMEAQARAALITGASRGLGRAIALALASDGFAVALAARDERSLHLVAAEAKSAGAPDTLVLAGDLRAPEEPVKAVEQAVAQFGGLDALVNNAGATARGDFLALTDEQHLDGFALKYHAMVRFCRAAWEPLVTRKGAIVNISGIGAHTPEPGFTIGGPVNSAVINFSKAISKRLDGPRVNVVSPGHIETDRLSRRIDTYAEGHGLTRDAAKEAMRGELGIAAYGQPDDIANMVRYLCSRDAAYVNGACFVVDGGATPGI